jgi:hypothetical protein
MALQGCSRIAIERRVDLAREHVKIDILGMKDTAAIREMMHGPAVS